MALATAASRLFPLQARLSMKFLWVCALILLVGCKKEPLPPPIRPVRAEIVESPDQARRRTFSGIAKASEETLLSFKVAGEIVLLTVNVGDAVLQEAVLAQLDSLDFELAVDQARAELEAAQARSRNASANYDRVRQLYETRTASRTDLDNARALSEEGIAAVASASKRLALAERQLAYTTLRAPATGSIAQRFVEVNENIQPNQPVLLIVSGTAPEVDVQIPELLIGQIQQGMPIEARFQAVCCQPLLGKVLHIGVATTGTATTYPVTLLIDDPDGKIRSGMTAEITFSLPNARETLLVPAGAVNLDMEGRYVYLVSDYDGRMGVIERRAVEVGELLNDRIEIVSGLEGGERVVTAGLDLIIPGSQVTIYRGKPYGEES
jgi:membrane fusion protein, multidrug efflux system